MNLHVDEHDYDSVTKCITELVAIRDRLIKHNTDLLHKNPKRERKLQTLEREYKAYKCILDSDISTVYTGDPTSNYYVYVHCNPLAQVKATENAKHMICAADLKLNYVPFYVGKGKDSRCFDLNRNEGHRKIRQMIESVGKQVTVHKIAQGLSECQAFALESKLIDILGLRQLDPENLLINLDEGKYPETRRQLYVGPDVRWVLNRSKMRLYNSVTER